MRSIKKRLRFRDISTLFTILVIYIFKPLILTVLDNSRILTHIYRAYFHDILAGIAIMAYINTLLNFFGFKVIKSIYHSVSISLLCGIVWEFFAPFLKNSAVFDYLDLIAYCVGASLYQLLINNKCKE